MTNPKKSRSARFTPQFNLLTLLILLTVVAIVLGQCTQLWHGARRQNQAVAAVQRLGGHVKMAEPTKAKGVISGWLHFFLGDEYFAGVSDVGMKVQSEADLHLLDAFSELEHLQLRGPALTDAAIGKLARFTQLKWLGLTGARIGQQGLKALVQFRNLWDLNLCNCTVSDGLERSIELPNLQYMRFISCDLSGATLRTLLTGSPNLQYVNFTSCDVSDATLKTLSELSNLRGVALVKCGLSDDRLEGFYGARSVVDLCLNEANVTEVGILALRNANPTWGVCFDRRRSYLDMKREFDQNYLPSVQQLPLVKKLDFSGTYTSDATLAVLANARSLTRLALHCCRISDDGLRNLGKLKHLARLALAGTNMSPSQLAKKRTELDYAGLTRSDCQITDQGLEYVSHFTALTCLDVWQCAITDQAMRYLGRMENLTSLYLGYVDITDDGLRGLEGLGRLHGLGLMHTKVHGPGLKWLPESITDLVLEETPISDEGLTNIARLSSLRSLSLYGTFITDSGLTDLSGISTLQSLTLGHTAVSDAGVSQLHKALPNCKIRR